MFNMLSVKIEFSLPLYFFRQTILYFLEITYFVNIKPALINIYIHTYIS